MKALPREMILRVSPQNKNPTKKRRTLKVARMAAEKARAVAVKAGGVGDVVDAGAAVEGGVRTVPRGKNLEERTIAPDPDGVGAGVLAAVKPMAM